MAPAPDKCRELNNYLAALQQCEGQLHNLRTNSTSGGLSVGCGLNTPKYSLLHLAAGRPAPAECACLLPSCCLAGP